ncbi:formate dehydrogenase subunit gamma [Poseidonocella sedimentorum]|uniref:Formate dehydrogenase gamma subunit n=1 Tax=Poseidonocella sedimentorum TaxID=871652 RepID=A0A1I6D373_9RHOB|nr:formate dehydrogenase subunit gamma [Poseidonocella sedimentorum]SFQ99919.1 formate dehydrogenase gamma subunit [Poseidonocella sedimentorum]
MIRHVLALMLTVLFAAPLATGLAAQDADLPPIDRTDTGGATTLEDILRRQEGLEVDDSYRREFGDEDAPPSDYAPGLGTLGGQSDADLWRGMRYNALDITTQARGPAADVLIQDGGMAWLQFREGPLARYGALLLGGTIVLLAVFYLIRGRIRIEGEKTGRTVKRFGAFERFSHWVLAGSFILLALTGLLSLFGRKVLIPLFGHEAFSTLAIASKWIHNNVSWAFMVALLSIFILWVIHNIPNRTDLAWIRQGGGFIGHGHPPAKKFNFGQKIIFWSVILFGASISVSGLSLLFPFEFPMFAATFEKANAFGLPALFGMDPLPTVLAPHQEMQLSQLWHAIVGFVLMAIIIAHIYIGTLGMEGAFDAMGSGEVEEQWAREHHSLWLEEVKQTEAATGERAATPAE